MYQTLKAKCTLASVTKQWYEYGGKRLLGMHPKQYLVSQLQSNVYPDSYTSMPTSQNHLNVIDK